MARMTLSDFVNELRARGFDGFQSDDLVRYINFGYRTVGRLTKWTWEEGDIPLTINPGEFSFSLATDLPTVKSIKAVVITTVNREGRLTPITDDDFYDQWAGFDLTSSQQRGEPDRYYLSSSALYILPPPADTRTLVITAEQILAELTSGVNEDLITPGEYDEAILLAAEEHCHIRARQPNFADVNRRKLQDFFDDALADETTRMSDRVDRVKAGRRWL